PPTLGPWTVSPWARGAIRARAMPHEAGAMRLDERRSAGIGEAGRRAGHPSGCGESQMQAAERRRRDGGRWRRPAVGMNGPELSERTLGVVEAEPAVLVRVNGLHPLEGHGAAQKCHEEEDHRLVSRGDAALHTRATSIREGRSICKERPGSSP